MNKPQSILFISLLIAGLSCTSAYADRYKVVKYNSSAIRIDDKPVEVGVVFDDHSTITWTKNEQALQVYNFTAKRQQLLVASGVTKQRKQTIMEVVATVHHLSTHDAVGSDLKRSDYDRLVGVIGDEYFMLDEIDIATEVEFSHGKQIIISYVVEDDIIEKQATLRGSHIIIPRGLFGVARGVSRNLIINIDMASPDENQAEPHLTPLKRGIRLHILPLKI